LIHPSEFFSSSIVTALRGVEGTGLEEESRVGEGEDDDGFDSTDAVFGLPETDSVEVVFSSPIFIGTLEFSGDDFSSLSFFS